MGYNLKRTRSSRRERPARPKGGIEPNGGQRQWLLTVANRELLRQFRVSCHKRVSCHTRFVIGSPAGPVTHGSLSARQPVLSHEVVLTQAAYMSQEAVLSQTAYLSQEAVLSQTVFLSEATRGGPARRALKMT